MRKFIMFITAVCILFLIKLRWPKNKSLYVSQNFINSEYKPVIMLTLIKIYIVRKLIMKGLQKVHPGTAL